MATKKKPAVKKVSTFTKDLNIVDRVMSPKHMLIALLIISLLANLAVGLALRDN